MMNPDNLSRSIFYVCCCRSSPETFKNSSTGLKLTNFQLDLVEESIDQVKIEAQMTH